ncbi:MAG TPA: hypothetical protein VG318_14955 [Actinomycetota bacterium]|nr:hypothetical protein [Actinomycetota bacterium]
MKKLIVTGLVAAVVAGALIAPAEAGKKKEKARVAEGTYDNPAVGIPGVAGTSNAGGAYEFGTIAGERFISVEVDDDSGGSPTLTFSQNTDTSDDSWEIFATACGKTEEPLPIEGGLPVRVSVYATPGVGQTTCVGPATSGTITATFTK